MDIRGFDGPRFDNHTVESREGVKLAYDAPGRHQVRMFRSNSICGSYPKQGAWSPVVFGRVPGISKRTSASGGIQAVLTMAASCTRHSGLAAWGSGHVLIRKRHHRPLSLVS